MNIDFENISQEKLLSLIFDFIEKNNMQDDSIIDVITEFSIKNNVDEMLIASELSDFKPFLEFAEKNLIKFKYLKSEENKYINSLELW